MSLSGMGKHRFSGAVLLVAGSSIGAGMLGLPIVTGLCGFYPAAVIFFLCWIFMSLTALLILEANLACEENTNYISMTRRFLGRWGENLCILTYTFLFYSILTAYIDAGGGLTQEFTDKIFNIRIGRIPAEFLFTFSFGVFVFLGTFFVDRLNRIFMFGLIFCYAAVLFFGSRFVSSVHLNHAVWKYSYAAVPVVITSFGYHNILPTLTHYLKKDRTKMIRVIFLGGFLPLCVYLCWDWLILGILPSSLLKTGMSVDGILRAIRHPLVGVLTRYFAFFAIATSFLAQALSLTDFIRDGFFRKNNSGNRLILVLLVLLPPLIFSAAIPGIFIKALGYVGGFAAVLLFVFFPVLMVWNLRYRQRGLHRPIVPGGKNVLRSLFSVGMAIVGIQLFLEWKGFYGN